VIAPVGVDLRVVAQVRMRTPFRRVTSMRVAMRVRVTERDEDARSLVRAIEAALRTLALAALVVAALFAAAAHAAPVVALPALLAGSGAVAWAALALVPLVAWPVVVRSHRTPRPALVAAVVPSPD
jgi:hypothetical protein